MKGILRKIGINMLSLGLTVLLIPGFHITSSLPDLGIAAIILTALTFIVKPVLQVLSLPFNIATFGLFTVITNTIVLWLLQRFVPSLIITTFSIREIGFAGFTIPSIEISSIILAYIVIAAVIALIIGVIDWLIS